MMSRFVSVLTVVCVALLLSGCTRAGVFKPEDVQKIRDVAANVENSATLAITLAQTSKPEIVPALKKAQLVVTAIRAASIECVSDDGAVDFACVANNVIEALAAFVEADTPTSSTQPLDDAPTAYLMDGRHLRGWLHEARSSSAVRGSATRTETSEVGGPV